MKGGDVSSVRLSSNLGSVHPKVGQPDGECCLGVLAALLLPPPLVFLPLTSRPSP